MGLDWPRYSFLSRVDHQASGCASSTHQDATTFYFRHTNTQGNADSQFTWGATGWLPVAGAFGLDN